ncbi:sulfotransferase 1C1-like isoform X2 [Tubulanus polymorphus]|uniref:sulfotransferase 1C1-like isoform X2 n=1 Tax=Tubulanus polymorphus TaxID=672921 RepID=UPI003DA1CA3F
MEQKLKNMQKIWPRPMELVYDCPLNVNISNKQLVDEVMNLEYKEDDIIIATYPKSGTTMTQEITWLVMNDGDVETARQENIALRIPFLEYKPLIDCNAYGKKYTSLELFLKQSSPRLGKFHLPWHLGPGRAVEEFSSKLIYVMRNPKDVAVSFFYFAQSFPIPYTGSFSDFLKVFMGPDMGFGNVFDHCLGYWKERHRKNILIIQFKDLVHDHRAQVVKIAKFLQKDLSDEVIDRIVEATSFKVMKENPMAIT